MTFTKEVQSQLFSPDTNRLICLPLRSTYPLPIAPAATDADATATAVAGPMGPVSPPGGVTSNGVSWTDDEHARFLLGLEMFPSGPWKAIANIVGTRTARQTMSHAQKYRQKIARRQRGVQQGGGAGGASALAASGNDSFGNDSMAAMHSTYTHSSHTHSSHTHSSHMTALMNESLADLHLTSEQIDEILQSLFEDDAERDNNDGDALVLTSDDMAAIMSSQ